LTKNGPPWKKLFLPFLTDFCQARDVGSFHEDISGLGVGVSRARAQARLFHLFSRARVGAWFKPNLLSEAQTKPKPSGWLGFMKSEPDPSPKNQARPTSNWVDGKTVAVQNPESGLNRFCKKRQPWLCDMGLLKNNERKKTRRRKKSVTIF
jgi:hypothetical protein